MMRKLIFSILIFFLAFFTMSVAPASAKIISNENGTVTIAKGEIINDDIFVNAQTVQIDGVVNGDVFIGAQSVRITGTVNGNLHAGTQTADLSGTVKGNVYLGAQNITLSAANLTGSLLAGAQNLTIDKASVIGGSVIAGAASASLDSQVKRNVIVGAGTLNIGDNVRIGKDLYYGVGENQASVSQKAVVSGSVHKTEAKKLEPKEMEKVQKMTPKLLNTVSTAVSFGAFVSSLIVAFLYFKLFGKHFTGSSNLVLNSFLKSAGVGFLVVIAIVPALVILLITVVGIPVAGLTLLIFLIYSYLAKIVVGSALGTWIGKKINWKMSVYGACAFGLLTIFVVKHIPFMGPLFGFMVFLAGLGALTLQTFAKSK